VPIWVSGTVNGRVARRIARFGSGWIPWGAAAADVATGIAQMREALAEIGHDASGLQIVGNLKTVRNDDGTVDIVRTADAVPSLVDAGVTDVRVALPLPSDDRAALDQLSALVAAFRERSGPGESA
jgi:alkanesulfonate monooxygenase SsuD/methylene tetrahydromethanopterin reductase-like flavin-dependent oxidoreductase (luciferase family)